MRMNISEHAAVRQCFAGHSRHRRRSDRQGASIAARGVWGLVQLNCRARHCQYELIKPNRPESDASSMPAMR